MPFVGNTGEQPPAGGGGSTPPQLTPQQQEAVQAAMGAYQQVFGALFAGTNTGAALKPVPAALSDIQNRDSAFDETSFLARAEYAHHLVQQAIAQQKPEMSRQVMADTLWLQHRDAILAAQRGGATVAQPPAASAAITAAHTDASFDTIVVRFTPTAGGQAQDWSFQRSAGAVTRPAAAATDRCPSCGAPLQLDESGVCSYCKAVVTSGQYDWVLVRTEPVANALGGWTTLIGPGAGMTMSTVAGIEVAERAGRTISNVVKSITLLVVNAFLFGGFELYDNIRKGNIFSSVPQTGNGTRYSGTFTLTGGVTTSALNLSGTSNTRPNCKALAANDTGATYTFNSIAGAQPSKFELDIDHPTGAGTWDQSQAKITVLQTLLTGSGGTQTWKAGNGSTVKFILDGDDKHSLTFSNLQPQAPSAPNAVPLSGTYSETCTNR